MRFLRFLAVQIDRINSKTGYLSSTLILLTVLITITDVTLRYLFHAGSVAFQELEWHLYAANFILAAGWTMLHDGHVRVDILYNRLSPRGMALVNLLGALLFCIPFCLIVLWSSWSFLVNSFAIQEGSPDPGGLPARYLLKATIPIGFGLVLLQALSQTLKAALALGGKEELPR